MYDDGKNRRYLLRDPSRGFIQDGLNPVKSQAEIDFEEQGRRTDAISRAQDEEIQQLYRGIYSYLLQRNDDRALEWAGRMTRVLGTYWQPNHVVLPWDTGVDTTRKEPVVQDNSNAVRRTKREQIERDFTYHPPKPERQEHYTVIREHAKNLAGTIIQLTPAGREQSLAITKLEEVIMWANAAIARNE